MAFICIILNTTDSIDECNERAQKSGAPKGEVAKLINYLSGCEVGRVNSTMQVTVRDTDPSIATSGTGSTQVQYPLS